VVIPKNRKNYVCQNREVILAAAQSKTSASARYTYTSSRSTRSSSIPKNIHTGDFKAGQKVVYQVKSGDTVSEIAAAYGVSTRSVMNWNGMATSRINVGQRLVIYPKSSKSTLLASAKKTTTQPKDGKYYTVQPGDTLWGIAKKLPGVTVSKIRQLNNLSSDRLSIGQRLKIG
jgi:membrane-bound lytic murein transglycosylase D